MLKIHKASAGSGKTYALTREYLKLLLGEKHGDCYRLRPMSSYGYLKPKAHGEILAVTFTNKATEEMTTRIINELAALAGNGGESPYLKEFLTIFGTDVATLQKHASAALSDLLYNFSWFNVSTIDSFFQRVLNTFARELELPANRNVELDDKFPIAVAVDKMLLSINRPSTTETDEEKRMRRHLENWLQQYMMTMVVGGKSFNLLSQSSSVNAGLISEMGNFFSEKYKLNREAIDEYLSDPTRMVRFAQAISPNGVLKERQEMAVALCKRAVAMGSDGVNRHVFSRLEKFANGGFTGTISATFSKALEEPAKCFLQKAKPMLGHMEMLHEAMIVGYEVWRLAQFYAHIYKQVFQFGLFGFVHRYLDEYRQQNESLLLSDTNDLLQRIINEDETPFIYERMGTSIKHYLIDEFQDTSQMQWENLKPLVLESLSQDNDNLIIGDEKQCIYRFRNSDPRLLGSRVESLVESRFPDSIQLNGVGVKENCNWRSSEDVVRFNNTLFYSFARLLDAEVGRHDIADTYSGLVQSIPSKHKGFKGYVNVAFLASGLSGAGEDEDSKSAQKAAAENAMLSRMVDEISRQLSAGYRPCDIAVLVRKRSQGKAVITRLMDVMENDPLWPHGVLPVMSADSMEISLSPVVRMIVDVLRLATQPAMITRPGGELGPDGRPLEMVNPVYRRYRLAHRYELCRFDMVEVIDEVGNVVKDAEGVPLRRRLTDSEALAKAVLATSVPVEESGDGVQAAIDEEIRRLSEMESPTILAMTERIIERFIPAEARMKENVFITAFQDLVMDYTERGEDNLNNFLKWWDRVGSTSNVAAPEGMNAINVLTIHKAKGLEYECVHVPYFSDELFKTIKSYSWYTLNSSYFPGVDPECVPPLMPLSNDRKNKEYEALLSEAQEWETEQRIDALNVAYVAFTRAVSELMVYVDKEPPSEGSRNSTPNMGDYLLTALRDMTAEHIAMTVDKELSEWMVPFDGALLEDGNDKHLEFKLGEPTVPRKKDVEEIEVKEEPCGDVNADLLQEYVVSERSEICATMDFEDLSDFSLANERHRGIFLHGVLSRVNHISDLPRALAAQAYRYKLTPAEIEECGEELQRALSDERVKRWFEGFTRVLTERPLSGDKTLRRPDRVVWLEDGTVAVIDYKFGELNLRSYYKQVRNYITLLADAGYPGAKGYLWFPAKNEIIEVS